MMLKKKLSSIFNKIKVQKQLYFIFFIAIFIPVITIGNYLVYNTRTLLFEHYEDQSFSDNLRVKSLLLDLTSSLYHKAQSLASDQKLAELLSASYPSLEEGAQALEEYEGFRTLLSQDASVQRAAVYTNNTSLPEGKYVHQVTEELAGEEWYQRAASTVTPFWSEEYAEDDFGNEELVLCLHTRIFLPQIRSYAILSLTVSNNHMKNRIENSTLDTVLWLDGRRTFYSSDKQNKDQSITRYVPGPGKHYSGKIELAQKNVIGCVSSLSTPYSDDLFYIATLNESGYPYINKITGIYLAILLLILFITSMFIYAYSRYFSRRVITLRETMHHASQGDYNITDTFPGEDEISEAFADLNVMVQDILHKEASVYEAQIRTQELVNQQQQIEFKMLASQINPHFLYNTLETIRMRAIKAGNLEVANAVKLLGKSMRYVLGNTTSSFTTLAKELEYIETYLAIQKLRFHDRVNYSLKVQPRIDLNEYQIMPLLLQPIVENAILHGLEEVEQNGRIIIHISKNEGTLRIAVFDNGCGMTPEEALVMEQNIYNHPKDSSKSIGLYNINQRICLCYGQEYGLKVTSRKNRGTLVTMILPAQELRKELSI